MAMPRVRGWLVALAASALVVAAISSGGCQVALKADPGDSVRCDLPDGEPCPGLPDLVCSGGVCRPPPGCMPDVKGEICNGSDDTCDGVIDEGFDADEDTFKVCGAFGEDGKPVPNTADCNDNDGNIHPGAPELCNGADDNCDGKADEEPTDCTDAGKECWTTHKDGEGKPDPICVPVGDCRLHGCTTGGCDTTTGKCTDPDCVSSGGVCKPGFTCDVKSRTCVRIVGAGDQCETDAVCPKDLHCIDSFTRGSICSKTCCISDECPDGLTCKSTGNAASVCVKELTVGTKTARSTCNTGPECRSGVCTSNKCIDGCCGSLTCGSGGTCAIQTGDQVFICRDASGSSSYGAGCADHSDCKSGVCFPLSGWLSGGFCSQHCCSSTDCPDTRDRCELRIFGSKPVNICAPFSSSGTKGIKRGGEICGGNAECRGDKCAGGRCDDTCCKDSDCGGGWICKPKFDGTYSPMRCVDPKSI